MIIQSARFVMSNTKADACPKPDMPEYAFIGRSNVGKSSLINMLVSQKNMAHTSGKPGKTQLINHFLVNDSWYIVDLPGYGYAKTSKENRGKWQEMIVEYLLDRPNLVNLFVLIDCRHELQKIDEEFLYWAGENSIPVTILLTKTDKLKRSQIDKHAGAIRRGLKHTWQFLPRMILTSSETLLGKDEVLQFIEECNAKFEKPSLK